MASFSILASSVNLTKKHERRGSRERKEDSSLPSGSLRAAAVSGYEKSMFCQRSLPIICEREDEYLPCLLLQGLGRNQMICSERKRALKSTLQMPSLIPRIVQGLSEKQKELQALKVECEGLPLA